MVRHRAIGHDDVVVDGQRRRPAPARCRELWRGTRAHLRRATASGRTALARRRSARRDARVDDHDLVAVVAGDVGECRRAGCERGRGWRRSGRAAAARRGRGCASASAWTHAIDDPGRMSWNCWVSTSCQSSSRSATRRRARRRPQLGLAQQLLASAVAELGADLARQRAAVGLEVQLAAPHRHRCAEMDLALDVLEELGRRADRRPGVHRRGRRAGALVRASRASVRRRRRRVRTASATSRSTRARRSCATACAHSAGVISALYVSTGGKWVSTRVPSSPSHQNVWWGNRFCLFHDNFWVTKRVMPPAANTCGRPAGYPNTSGIHTSVQRRPKCCSK